MIETPLHPGVLAMRLRRRWKKTLRYFWLTVAAEAVGAAVLAIVVWRKTCR